MNVEYVNPNITRLTLPYKDIYTTIYSIKTDSGVLLFDVGSFDSDMNEYIIPFLEETKIPIDSIKGIYISHNHADHSGGLREFLHRLPQVYVYSQCESLKQPFDGYNIKITSDNEYIFDVLKVISIPGHTSDSSAILDTRSNIMITGDCLQLFGIYGSGKWACNIGYPDLHIKAIDKLYKMDISVILTAHDYHPCGYKYSGVDEIKTALDACIKPLLNIKKLIIDNSSLNDEQICDIYNNGSKLPTLGAHVVTAIRNKLI